MGKIQSSLSTFSRAASDGTRDSIERAKFKGPNGVFTSASFVFNPGVIYDALTELGDLSRLLQKRDTPLPEADKLQWFHKKCSSSSDREVLCSPAWQSEKCEGQFMTSAAWLKTGYFQQLPLMSEVI